jgi:hypothetical protein
MRAAISLPTTGTIPVPCSTISATRTFSTPVRYTELSSDRFRDFWRD